MFFILIGKDTYGRVGASVMTKTKSKYTNDHFVPVKSIVNGMIILDNNYYITGVKIMPKNIFILDQLSQDSAIVNLRRVYDSIDYEFWMIAADRPVDINVYLSNLELLYNNSQNQIKKKLIRQDINKANMFMNNNVVDTEFYILFKDKDMQLCQKRIRNLINNLAQAGLTSYQTSNEDLRIIIDNFLNGGKSTTFGTVIG